MTTAREWLAGARPRTLPAAAAPVLVGTGAAAQVGGAHLGRAALALGVALALQVGVNYANDYSDGVRGTDVDRVGPLRLTASGTARPGAVRAAAFTAFGVAAVVGLALVLATGDWWLLGVGVLAIGAAWTYTGGKSPYGYRGLGEVGVFVFFGLVAVLGTTWTQAAELPWTAWAGAVAIGLLACALLMANNLRDVPTDALVGKRTLAVRLGERRARRVYAAFVLLPMLLGLACAAVAPWAWLVALLLAPAGVLAGIVLLGARGRALVPVLAGTGMLELAFGVLLGLGLAL
ncbi:1,4-dihydroxy-2-naphthoate polyprenyltransferase [Cellulomonas fimi]|uniref:1,4-dihydroxy-2-naphthoate octaprenyltransferase n=1 Tax=Cellulomonas fimi (strain ATCC 484 / DSM 20113 / JCM 1341 / CCUG 24087 / LMG 16345 / NBRC 15513 / NCIMB 8980 / NCTC 7547 / NRS-133) TaxID=590998 RepID=F4H185_CELFA|nr:1,4-dihydroxy-2-naphthoate polyprenyltransferase [Cellulomonas fimi]AEE45056.1 1,4-dihydroxy-2-naphthoate octaprenyltransferase [Cellulomonas fimi ATCC 484]NNH07969.1 1,4-dihydroxy-2-naphthoate polyprenyltransferase [Cellulomonas fimi]VEH28107.1 1,4-dihydroxy-2-naphthoate octaprenyltransferase [Cellulomonas fimi]